MVAKYRVEYLRQGRVGHGGNDGHVGQGTRVVWRRGSAVVDGDGPAVAGGDGRVGVAGRRCSSAVEERRARVGAGVVHGAGAAAEDRGSYRDVLGGLVTLERRGRDREDAVPEVGARRAADAEAAVVDVPAVDVG